MQARTWEQFTKREQYQTIYSDMYKDAYGFRPRSDTSSWSYDDFEQEFRILSRIIEADIERERAEQAEATEVFEKRVQILLECGAKDREQAIRWIHEAEDTHGDPEYLCFTLNLPYGYFK